MAGRVVWMDDDVNPVRGPVSVLGRREHCYRSKKSVPMPDSCT